VYSKHRNKASEAGVQWTRGKAADELGEMGSDWVVQWTLSPGVSLDFIL
jgi:hypothetical protein